MRILHSLILSTLLLGTSTFAYAGHDHGGSFHGGIEHRGGPPPIVHRDGDRGHDWDHGWHGHRHWYPGCPREIWIGGVRFCW